MSTIPPVAIFAFNRPEYVREVFARVRSARPEKLFVCLDAPRKGNAGDVANREEVSRILEGVDWPCEVFKNYAQENMGCRRRMSSGISWVFDHVEAAILLEDDCVPHADFFPYCAELLNHYRHDTRVGMIAGHIEHFSPIEKKTSYYFDRFPTIIGWATWRRAWQLFDAQLEEWPRLRKDPFLQVIFPRRRVARQVAGFFEGVHSGKANSWATIWWLSMIRNNMLCIHPCRNLITNVGVYGVHNIGRSKWHNVPSSGISFPLVHPAEVMPDSMEERRMVKVYAPPSVLSRARYKAKQWLAMVAE